MNTNYSIEYLYLNMTFIIIVGLHISYSIKWHKLYGSCSRTLENYFSIRATIAAPQWKCIKLVWHCINFSIVVYMKSTIIIIIIIITVVIIINTNRYFLSCCTYYLLCALASCSSLYATWHRFNVCKFTYKIEQKKNAQAIHIESEQRGRERQRENSYENIETEYNGGELT